MKIPIRTVAVAAMSLAFAYVIGASQRPGEAKAQAGSATVQTSDGMAMPMPGMTTSEHLAHMAKAGDIHAGHALEEMAWPAFQAAPANKNLPADEQGAAARLAASPRKSAFVTVDVGGKPMRTWIVYPQRRDKAPVVVVIQEIFGLSDWIRGVADQLAAEGYIAIAPDLLAGHGANGGDSSSLTSQQETTQATLTLPAAEILAKLKAARAYGVKLPEANGKSASVGFCFGGNQSFAFAVDEPALNAAVVYYGTPPTDVQAPARAGGPGVQSVQGAPAAGAPAPFVSSDRLANINAPVLGLYGGQMQDPRIANSVPATQAKMKALGKTYEPHIFDGAAHGFLRAQTGNDGANMKATDQAWPLTLAWLKRYTA